jgi:hypothetical protein
MLDFIGQPLVVGAWVAISGRGNGAAEYGMVLGRVVSLDPLRIERLDVNYFPGDIRVKRRSSIIKNQNKWVVVQPTAPAIALWERCAAPSPSQADARLLGDWLHGKKAPKFA